MPIHLLAPEVASQIAAGEVVERPASVAKELIENALDAGAKFISVTTEGAGKRLIEIADDGCGIPYNEMEMAVARHATSKLSSAEDLFRIKTLGFRGEALASIGSVALFTLTSRPAQADAGGRLRVEGGKIGEVQAVGAPVGTVVRVENLFYNLPARMKFLKSDPTERALIDGLVTRYALAYPHVRFHLKQEGRPALQTSGKGDRREVLAALYGVDVARQMLEVLADEDGLGVTGYISPTSLTRSNRKELTFFVNGRPVQDPSLSTALLQAYHNLLMVGRFPLCVLFLDLPPEEVDVNVHPTKAEVRFRQRDRVFNAVQHAARRALLAYTPVPNIETQKLWGLPRGKETWDPGWDMSAETTSSTQEAISVEISAPDTEEAISQSLPSEPAVPDQASLPGTRVPILRLIGQVAATYLIAEGPDGLYLIDQHAAHERVLFERFMSQRSSLHAQTLLQPATVDLPPATARLLGEQLPILARFGFEVEPFGLNTFLVRAIPAILAGSDPAAAVRVLVEDFEEDETPLQAEVEARVIARVCKRAAVKAGQALSQQEQQALLTDLENCVSPRTCPHGRPTMIHLSVDLLERQFGRRGAR